MTPPGNDETSGVVSYRLARERLVRAVEDGHTKTEDVCDAQPELRRVAHHHASNVDEPCPICHGDDLVAVLFAFGSGLPAGGRLVADNDELRVLRRRGRPATCYLIEVCRQCWWNHLRESFEISGGQIASSAG
jgi:hypothetical protein